MISLGGVELCRTLIWEEPYESLYQAYSRRLTLLGNVVIQTSPISGRLISLATMSTAKGSIGYFLKSQLDQLRVFEKAATVIAFVYETENIQVLIQPGGINVSPIAPRTSPSLTDYYTGSINLIEVIS